MLHSVKEEFGHLVSLLPVFKRGWEIFYCSVIQFQKTPVDSGFIWISRPLDSCIVCSICYSMHSLNSFLSFSVQERFGTRFSNLHLIIIQVRTEVWEVWTHHGFINAVSICPTTGNGLKLTKLFTIVHKFDETIFISPLKVYICLEMQLFCSWRIFWAYHKLDMFTTLNLLFTGVASMSSRR